ncbi:LacI family DNA-binding transcriptional regulator [Brachybacterium sp. J144]|uniref:LacI family DNA-binding transcriptional regulator n=1 Tax=Brachybacterium sp. J144 TaxID=3116487 RepID=UPI002E7909C1|nr:LacI family DNA-binding transcriptional regulator [Brachybacterium sp. J144]MEE1650656.1 LacI family DNA-binding transcriptional regulator [Brachybacterium sp. J144]
MGAPSGRATLADVARAAGVSASAASMALNRRGGVRQETRLRVLAAARTVGYRARRSAVRDATVLGVIPTDLGNAYHTDVITGIERFAESVGYAVVIGHGRRDGDHLERQLERMLGFGVDGVIAVTTWLSPSTLAAAAAVLPVAVIGRMQDPVPGTDAVRCDDAAGAALAVRHLVQRGHRRLAHVTMSSRPGPASRRAGFTAEAARLGLVPGLRSGSASGQGPGSEPGGPAGGPTGSVEVIGPEANWAAMDARIDDLMRRIRSGDPAAPTAVFAANDVAAVRVLHWAADLGVRVPEQLSVVGYDSSTVALTVQPHLTSVNQPREEMGRLAAEMIRERLAGRAHDADLLVQPVLRERDSTGPAPRARR